MSELLKPPAVPSAILNFFAAQPDFPALAGDISEEFHHRAANVGSQAARQWFWREAFRNAFALTWREVRRTPFLTTLVALGCYLAVNLASLPLQLFNARQFYVLVLLNLTASFAMGWIGAKLLSGREWALALTYTVVTLCITLPILWHFFFAFPLRDHLPVHFRAVLIGGQAVRQSIFWLGSLLVRYINNRKHSSIVSAAKSA